MKGTRLARHCGWLGGAVLAVAVTLTAQTARADSFQGAIFTSDVNHNTNVNFYSSFADIYLNGGGGGVDLDSGRYCYAITSTNGNTLFSSVGDFIMTPTDNANHTPVFFNLLSGLAPEGGPVGSGVSIIGNPNENEYKLLVGRLGDWDTQLECPDTAAGLKDLPTKSDNFKVGGETTTASSAPEPCSLALLAGGSAPLLMRRRRRTVKA